MNYTLIDILKNHIKYESILVKKALDKQKNYFEKTIEEINKNYSEISNKEFDSYYFNITAELSPYLGEFLPEICGYPILNIFCKAKLKEPTFYQESYRKTNVAFGLYMYIESPGVTGYELPKMEKMTLILNLNNQKKLFEKNFSSKNIDETFHQCIYFLQNKFGDIIEENKIYRHYFQTFL